MANVSQAMEDRLLAAQIAIDNSLSDAEIQPFLAEYGYDAAKIGAGKALYDTAQDLHQIQIKEYGEQYAATDELKAKWDKGNAVYMRHIKVSRVAFENDRAAYHKLDLGGKRKVSLSGWLAQSKQFYINALADSNVLTELAEFCITQAKLEAGKQLVDETEAANADQKKEKGEAQQATIDRDEAIDNLEGWMSDFIAIARIALEDKPQLLEKLGIVKPS